MTTLSYAVSDSATMLRRNLRHALRYPGMTVSVVAMPILFLLLFVYVFGGTLGAGIGGANGSASYVDYVAPGIILMTAASAAVSTAVSVCVDMTEGIVARFRTMAIFRPSMLNGHVVGSIVLTLLSMGLVIGVSLLLGFRPTADPIRWIEAIGLLAMLTLAITWLAVALGLVSKSPETASNLPMPLLLLPFLGSGFVPTDSMPVGLRWFAEYQPFTPLTETLRALLLGTRSATTPRSPSGGAPRSRWPDTSPRWCCSTEGGHGDRRGGEVRARSVRPGRRCTAGLWAGPCPPPSRS